MELDVPIIAILLRAQPIARKKRCRKMAGNDGLARVPFEVLVKADVPPDVLPVMFVSRFSCASKLLVTESPFQKQSWFGLSTSHQSTPSLK
jgi:hypothetical protein